MSSDTDDEFHTSIDLSNTMRKCHSIYVYKYSKYTFLKKKIFVRVVSRHNVYKEYFIYSIINKIFFVDIATREL